MSRAALLLVNTNFSLEAQYLVFLIIHNLPGDRNQAGQQTQWSVFGEKQRCQVGNRLACFERTRGSNQLIAELDVLESWIRHPSVKQIGFQIHMSDCHSFVDCDIDCYVVDLVGAQLAGKAIAGVNVHKRDIGIRWAGYDLGVPRLTARETNDREGKGQHEYSRLQHVGHSSDSTCLQAIA